MQDNLFTLFWSFRKQIILVVAGAALLAAALSFLMPEEYLSEARALPVNSKMMDKQAMLGHSNIQELYSTYGSSDDLDRLMAIAHSPAVLMAVCDSLQLSKHYGISGNGIRQKAVKKLEKNLKLKRSEYGEMQLMVWDKDPAVAKAIAEQVFKSTQVVYDRIYTEYFDRGIARMEREHQQMEKDTLKAQTLAGSNELRFIRDRITENRIAKVNPPPAFFVLSAPELPELPDRPRLLMNVLLAALAALATMLTWILGRSAWKSGYAAT